MNENDLFKSLIKSSCSARMQRYLRTNDVEIGESLKEPAEGVFDQEMSIIMLWGMIGSVTLKVHFNLETAVELTAVGQNMPRREINPKMAREYLKEFSNNHAGYLKGFLEQNRIMMGMSLPFLASGTDELVFRKIRDPRATIDIWKMKYKNQEIVCSSEVCLLDFKSISQIRMALESETEQNFKKQNLDDDGEINFL